MPNTTPGRAEWGVNPQRTARIAPMLQDAVDRGLMAGAVTLVWQKGELLQGAAVGYRELAARLPMASDTLFRLASMTKPIISLAALMMVEAGELRLEDPVTGWLPELAGARILSAPQGALHDTTGATRDITVEDLLTHRSGLGAGFTTTGPISEAYDAQLRLAYLSPDDWLAAIGRLPLCCAPGERFQYGHSTDVLGLLMTRRARKPLSEILRQSIFEPLGMRDTMFWVPPQERHRVAHMYQLPEQPGPLRDISFPHPDRPPAFESGSGGLFSTASDYLRFARLMLGQGEVDGVRLAKPQTIALMTTNRLTPRQRSQPFLGVEDFWAGRGFGLGVAMILDPSKVVPAAPASIGSYGWPGAFGTTWLADPVEDRVMIFLAQDFFTLNPDNVSQLVNGQRPGARSVQTLFQQMVYAELAVERPKSHAF